MVGHVKSEEWTVFESKSEDWEEDKRSWWTLERQLTSILYSLLVNLSRKFWENYGCIYHLSKQTNVLKYTLIYNHIQINILLQWLKCGSTILIIQMFVFSYHLWQRLQKDVSLINGVLLDFYKDFLGKIFLHVRGCGIDACTPAAMWLCTAPTHLVIQK